jgi:hypothetical protein
MACISYQAFDRKNVYISPNSFSKRLQPLRKNNTEGAWYFNAAANEIIGTDVYDHLTGSGAQSLKCLLPIFDPDGVGQNPSDFFCFFAV